MTGTVSADAIISIITTLKSMPASSISHRELMLNVHAGSKHSSTIEPPTTSVTAGTVNLSANFG